MAKENDPTANAITMLVEQLLARQPTDPNNLGLPEDKRRELTASTRPQRYRCVPCKSEDTEATFMATVVESHDKAKFPHGRITRIESYRYPVDGMDLSISNGGRVPDGLEIFKHDSARDLNNKNALTMHYLQWRTHAFMQTDFPRYVGRALTPGMCGEAIDTPWLTSGAYGTAA